MASGSDAMTVPKFMGLKKAGRKIVMLTAYDYPTAALVDAAGVDGILVGDSLGMVIQGHATTLPVTMRQMLYHAEMVGRAVHRALLVADMPFLSYQLGVREAIRNAGLFLKRTRCQAVKLEQGPQQLEITRALVAAGIPVMAHFGLRPQSIHQLGGYRVARGGDQILSEALAAQEAGAFAVLLEYVPAALAQKITAELSVPTIGIGSGPHCDGQILVLHDILGLGRVPRHAKAYANLAQIIRSAVEQYCQEVRDGIFPGPEHSFS
ncbi:MAG: 3-methyl-2-oxobutanoate hydroxymethyltransferase [Thermoguttaceae bacterium]|nr:3-methyl-2-oxobutanoate hydroxymethyltransferase [Thermoguttaceae bacterium]